MLQLPVHDLPMTLPATTASNSASQGDQTDLEQTQAQTLASQVPDPGLVSVSTPWVPTLFVPYVRGLSERLRSVCAKYSVRSWFSYQGMLQETVSQFKDPFHCSKSQNAIYSVSCDCGMHYVGESARNLKIRIHEHAQKSSKSTISLYILESNEQQ